MLGLRPEQVTGKSIEEIMGTEGFETVRPHIEIVLQGQPVEYEAEIPLRRTGRRFLRVTYMPEKNDQGDIIGWIASITDITERKQAEAALQQAKDALANANEQLETRVQQRTADLQQAQAALMREIEEQKRLEQQLRQAQKMESLGTLAGGIAHEFNNILNIISGSAQLISRHSANAEIAADSLKNIHQSIKRGASVVRELLTLARKTEAHLTAIDANGAVSELVKLLRQTFPKDIEISLDLDPQLPSVMADPGQITQALLNLCLNARDAMPAGGWLIINTRWIDGKQVQQIHAGATEAHYIGIEVSDTGVGMDESTQKRIFEPFFTTKEVGAGTGLGLAIVYGIMTNHKGFIDADSKLGRGTTFRLYLPVVPPEDQPAFTDVAMAPQPDRGPANGKGTVLLVEDEEAMAHLLRDTLLQRGYRVLLAINGEEAVDLYIRNKQGIDVVVLDIGLPKMKGWDVFLKMKEENPGVKVIVATGYLDPELKSRIHTAGVRDFIQKPYTFEFMEAKLAAVMERA
jgi:PAS domain S-box-containing protein